MSTSPKAAVLIFAALVYLAALAAVSTLTGVGTITPGVGVPLISSTITLVLGAALALINPAEALVRPTPTPEVPSLPAAPSTGPAMPQEA